MEIINRKENQLPCHIAFRNKEMTNENAKEDCFGEVTSYKHQHAHSEMATLNKTVEVAVSCKDNISSKITDDVCHEIVCEGDTSCQSNINGHPDIELNKSFSQESYEIIQNGDTTRCTEKQTREIRDNSPKYVATPLTRSKLLEILGVKRLLQTNKESNSDKQKCAMSTSSIEETNACFKDSTCVQFPCGECDQVFNLFEYLQVHKQIHKEDDLDGFKHRLVDISTILSTTELVSSAGKFKCNHDCSKTFGTTKEMIHHIILNHSIEYQCHQCEEVLLSKDLALKHKMMHLEGLKKLISQQNVVEEYKCELCDSSFSNVSNLRRHTANAHYEKCFQCSKCSKICSSAEVLQKHEATHKQFACEVDGCQKIFNSKKTFMHHSRSHSDGKRFVCKVCDKTFASAGKLNVHQQYHSTERKYKCPTCDKCYKTSDVLSKHMRIHSKTRRFYCEICGKGFDQSGSVKRHLGMHNNELNYTCEICNMSFRQKISLKGHKLRTNHYTEEEEAEKQNKGVQDILSCEYCNKQFPDRNYFLYQRHVRIHTGDRPYKCTICDKAFSDRSNLRYHVMAHEDNRPFKCEKCGKGFIHKRTLNLHLKSSAHSKMLNEPVKRHMKYDGSWEKTSDETLSQDQQALNVIPQSKVTQLWLPRSDDISTFQYQQENMASEAEYTFAGSHLYLTTSKDADTSSFDTSSELVHAVRPETIIVPNANMNFENHTYLNLVSSTNENLLDVSAPASFPCLVTHLYQPNQIGVVMSSDNTATFSVDSNAHVQSSECTEEMAGMDTEYTGGDSENDDIYNEVPVTPYEI